VVSFTLKQEAENYLTLDGLPKRTSIRCATANTVAA
jgi:hypothetical protein